MPLTKHQITYLACAALVIAAFLLGHSSGADVIGFIPSLDVVGWAGNAISWLNDNLEWLFDIIAGMIEGGEGFPGILTIIEWFFTATPQLFLIVLFGVIGYLANGWRLSAFVVLALLFISSMGYFNETMVTLSLVLTATLFSLVIGIPIGVLKARSPLVTQIIDPILDFMQTMPLFVYLIPAVLFFSIGNIPGVVATFIFATPPAVRLTALGIEQIPKELIEASKAFGATPWQFLTKVEIPLALPSIMAGVNQTIMLALSMVVIASMVGAEGLGSVVFNAITRLNVGAGIASGIGIVLLAMILDRLTKTIGAGRKES